MDHYPQPRPVLYGTSAEDAPPQTQPSPVRTGPPRWPPAPPSAGAWDGDWNGSSRRWHSYLPAEAYPTAGRGRFVLAALYALASLYALYQVAFLPQAFAELTLASRLFLLLQIVAALWVVPCFAILRRWEYLVALAVSVIQLLLGAIAGEWNSPGLVVALCGCIYLLRPSMLVTRSARPLWDLYGRTHKGLTRPFKRAVHVPHFERPDDWKMKIN